MTLTLRQVYTLSLYGLAAFAAWMLGRAEMGDDNRTWWIPMATWGVLGISYFVTEGPRGWYLPAWVANLIGLSAVIAAGLEFATPGPEAKLLSGAHLLVYSTWIVAFQEKTLRIYWWIMALGILQVAVASVLTSAAWFGLCLFLYVAAALWTMSVASLHQIQLQYGGEGVVSAAGNDQQTSQFVQYDERHRWLTGRFVGGWLILLTASMLVGGAFFRFTPRMWIGPRNFFASDAEAGIAGRSTTGFSKDVRLGELGEILESVKPVMRVQVTDARTELPVDLDRFAQRLGMSEALFRGATLSRYQRGRWGQVQTGRPMKLRQSFTQPGFRIDFDVEPRRDDVLFSIGLPVACAIKSRNEAAYLHPATGLVTREAVPDAAQRMSYTMYLVPPTTELAAMQATALPVGVWWQSIETGYLRDNLLLPPQGLERLIELAQRLVAEGERKAGRSLSNYERARLLEAHLRDSGEFAYTLNLSIKDASIDPVEDFLFNRKEGHCEYYASTLALMLRAVGIPSRLVTGFKGAEPSTGSDAWDVQERHAHAWVEAWTSTNLWVTLDATPANERQRNIEAAASKVGFWERLQASSSTFWTDYVVQVTLQRQEEEIYGPLRDFGLKIWAVLKSLFAARSDTWETLREKLGDPAVWTSPLGLLLLAVTATVLIVIGRWLAGRLRWVWSIDWQAWRRRRRQERAVVAFYERFTKLAARAGLRRPPAQTPAEFAEVVRQFWSTLLEPAQLATVPATVCTAYYRVRFGGETLDEAELARLDQDLQSLAHLVTPGRRP